MFFKRHRFIFLFITNFFLCTFYIQGNLSDITSRAPVPNSISPDQNDAIVGLACGDSVAIIEAINCAKNTIIEEICDCCSGTSSTLLEEILEEIIDVQTTLEACCTDLFSTMTTEFNGVFTVLADLDSSCCGTILSVLEEIEADIVDIQTSLDACCTDLFSTMTTEFNGVFTVLADLDSGCCGTVVEIFSTMTTNFNGVFTVLAEIEADIVDVQTTLEACCTDLFSTMTTEFNGVFTMLVQIEDDILDIQTSVSTCCVDLFSTMTTNFNGVFTVLAEIEADIVDVQTTLEACCTDLFSTMTTEFNGVFTVLTEIEADILDVQTSLIACCTTLTTMLEGICTNCCETFSLTQADIGTTGTVISNPGRYIFAEDITFSPGVGANAITVAADDVTIDMCGNRLIQGNSTIGVIGINTDNIINVANLTIQNGTIENFRNGSIVISGVSADPVMTNILISNVVITTPHLNAILLAGASGFPITNVMITDILIEFGEQAGGTFTGINLTQCNNVTINKTTITKSEFSGTFQGVAATNCDTLLIDNNAITFNGSAGTPITTFNGILLDADTLGYSVKNTLISSNTAVTFSGIRCATTGSATVGWFIENCVVKNNVATTGSFEGIACANISRVVVQNNTVINNLAEGATTSSVVRAFYFDRITYGLVANNKALYNYATGNGGTTGVPFYDDFQVAGFEIGTSSAVAGLGVKESQFIGNSAYSNNGFDNARSYGFRVLTPASSSVTPGNENNLYLSNIAVRNGPDTESSPGTTIINQIIPNSAVEGGVPIGAITSALLANINTIADQVLTNVAIVQ